MGKRKGPETVPVFSPDVREVGGVEDGTVGEVPVVEVTCGVVAIDSGSS